MTDIRQQLVSALDSYEAKCKERAKRKESRVVVIAPNQHDRNLLIDELTLMASFNSGEPVPTRAFRTPSRETTKNELSEIADYASDLAKRLRDPKCSVKRAREQLAQRLEDMHETTICALSTVPALIIHNKPAVLNVAFVRRELPGRLRDDSIDSKRLAIELEPLAQAAKMAEAPDTKDKGRWPDYRAQAVTRLLARFYQNAEGLEPVFATRNVKKTGEANDGRHYGAFLDLVSSIFDAMNIEREAYSFAYRAANELREQGRKSAP